MTEKEKFAPLIEFAETLIDKYDSGSSSARKLREQLGIIKYKQLDDKLNLSVVGEFSIGKSSFISALIRRELLESAALQGTTVASTILDSSPTFSLAVKYRDGRLERFEFDDENNLREYIRRYSSNPEYAADTQGLYAAFPSDNLRDARIRIIDTPGTNSTEVWHEETTIRTINEMSDASIILVDATRPLPESQKNFIREHLADVLDRCAFVVTKIDLLRPKERGRMTEYVRKTAEFEFGLENPPVLPYSSTVMTRFLVNGEEPDERSREMLDTFIRSERELFDFIAQKKAYAQTKKIKALLGDLYNELSERMPILSQDYQRRHDILTRTKNTDMSVFISIQINSRAADFYTAAAPYQREITDAVFTEIFNRKQMIMSALDSLRTKNELRQFASQGFAELCRRHGSEILNATENNCRILRRFVTEQLDAFKTEFKTAYSQLGLLPIPDELGEIRVKHIRADAVEIASADSLPDVITGRNERLFRKIALISPAKMKEELREAVQEPMNDYFAKISELYEDNVKKYVSDLSLSVSREITRYYRRYNSYVSEKIREDEALRRGLERKIAEIRADMRSVAEKRGLLRS